MKLYNPSLHPSQSHCKRDALALPILNVPSFLLSVFLVLGSGSALPRAFSGLLPAGMRCGDSCFCAPLLRVSFCPCQFEEWEERELVLLPEERENVSVLHPPHGESSELLLDRALRGRPQHALRGNGALRPAGEAHHCAV